LGQQDFDGPQKAGAGQVLVIEQYNTGSSGTGRRYRNVGEHPLTLAWKRGSIADGLHDAGGAFRALYEQMGRSGLDSTQALCSSRSSGASPSPFTQTQVDAINQIKRIEERMYRQNYRIVRNFCGEGMSMRESVLSVTSMHANGIRDRVVEALADLDVVLEKLHIRKAA
jgi:hypothetical protein